MSRCDTIFATKLGDGIPILPLELLSRLLLWLFVGCRFLAALKSNQSLVFFVAVEFPRAYLTNIYR